MVLAVRVLLQTIISRLMILLCGITTVVMPAAVLAEESAVRIYRAEGEIWLNAERVADSVQLTEQMQITLAPNARFQLRLGPDALMIHGGSKLLLTTENDQLTSLQLEQGQIYLLLAELPARQQVSLSTPEAHLAMAGGVVYLESERARSYVDVCQGKAMLTATMDQSRQPLTGQGHDAARFIYRKNSEELITRARAGRHSDREMAILYKIAGIQPPFGHYSGLQTRVRRSAL